MGKPIKRYLKINEQVEHLKEEKMQISDEEFAKSILSRVNYYHLSGYWHTLYSENKEFIPGTTFEQVHHLYQFDCELRFLITELLKDLEIKFKAVFIDHTLVLSKGTSKPIPTLYANLASVTSV